MKKKYQIPISMILALLVTADAHGQTTEPEMDSAITVTASKPLGAVAEAEKIEFAMEREGSLGSNRAFSTLSATRMRPLRSDDGRQEAVFTSSTSDSRASVNRSLLQRNANSLRAMVLMGGLEEGVHVMWWVIFNSPENCRQPIPGVGAKCGGGDGSDLDREDASIYWAGGAVVKSDGFGLFHAKTSVGDEPRHANEHAARKTGLTNPRGAEVHLIINYVGRASEEVEDLSRQLLTSPEGCLLRAADSFAEASDSSCQGEYRAVYTSEKSAKTPRFEL